MIYFGMTDIPGLFNVCDAAGRLTHTDVTLAALSSLANAHGGAEFIPPPEPRVELSGGMSFPLSHIEASAPEEAR